MPRSVTDIDFNVAADAAFIHVAGNSSADSYRDAGDTANSLAVLAAGTTTLNQQRYHNAVNEIDGNGRE